MHQVDSCRLWVFDTGAALSACDLKANSTSSRAMLAWTLTEELVVFGIAFSSQYNWSGRADFNSGHIGTLAPLPIRKCRLGLPCIDRTKPASSSSCGSTGAIGPHHR